MEQKLVKFSKFLSLVLRHDPGKIGLKLDNSGWADIDELLAKAAKNGKVISREELDQVVAENDKKRFALSEDGKRIRASQGHSVEVDLGLTPTEPPTILYHGTARTNIASIKEKGLIKGSRQHVHLSVDTTTAKKVGSRHGSPITLAVDTKAMIAAGHKFYVSDNGVWLTDHVPPEFILGGWTD